jgi:hypothetical protein
MQTPEDMAREAMEAAAAAAGVLPDAHNLKGKIKALLPLATDCCL